LIGGGEKRHAFATIWGGEETLRGIWGKNLESARTGEKHNVAKGATNTKSRVQAYWFLGGNLKLKKRNGRRGGGGELQTRGKLWTEANTDRGGQIVSRVEEREWWV